MNLYLNDDHYVLGGSFFDAKRFMRPNGLLIASNLFADSWKYLLNLFRSFPLHLWCSNETKVKFGVSSPYVAAKISHAEKLLCRNTLEYMLIEQLFFYNLFNLVPKSKADFSIPQMPCFCILRVLRTRQKWWNIHFFIVELVDEWFFEFIWEYCWYINKSVSLNTWTNAPRFQRNHNLDQGFCTTE